MWNIFSVEEKSHIKIICIIRYEKYWMCHQKLCISTNFQIFPRDRKNVVAWNELFSPCFLFFFFFSFNCVNCVYIYIYNKIRFLFVSINVWYFTSMWFKQNNYLVGNFDSHVRQQFGRFGGAIWTSHCLNFSNANGSPGWRTNGFYDW